MNPFLPLALVASLFSFTGTGVWFVAVHRRDEIRRRMGSELLTIGALLTGLLLLLRFVIVRG